MTKTETTAPNYDMPDIEVNVRQIFGIDSDMQVPGFAEPNEHVPEIDSTYIFGQPGQSHQPY